MDSATWGAVVALLTGGLWLTGAVLQWRILRRQEKLIARMRRRPARHLPKPVGATRTLTPQESAGPRDVNLRPSNRWTVG
jgi:hypothetical protein